MSNEPNTRSSGMKQDIEDTRTEFTQSLAALRGSMDEKFQSINSQLVNIKYDLTKNVENIVNDILSKIKDAIIERRRAENLKLQQKVESLESRVSKLGTDCNKQDQYNRRNNLEIHGIPSNISDDVLAEKVIQIFERIDLSLTANDIEDCHHLDKSGNNTIVSLSG